MGRFVDSLIAYRILKLLVTPFDKTDAYKLGIIDAKGKELKRMQELNSVNERDAYTLLHRLVFRIKKIIEKVPIDNKKILSLAAAYALIKEAPALAITLIGVTVDHQLQSGSADQAKKVQSALKDMGYQEVLI